MVLSSIAGTMIYMQVKKCHRVLSSRLLEITEGSKDRYIKKNVTNSIPDVPISNSEPVTVDFSLSESEK